MKAFSPLLFLILLSLPESARAIQIPSCPQWLAYWVMPAGTEKLEQEILKQIGRRGDPWLIEWDVYNALYEAQVYASPTRTNVALEKLTEEGNLESQLVIMEETEPYTIEEYRLTTKGRGRRKRNAMNLAPTYPWWETLAEWLPIPGALQPQPVPIPLPVRPERR